MSTDLVINEIKRFLHADRPEVLCIRGRWGVGKTYAWRRYLEEALSSGLITPQDYAYVSLFGLNSLEDLRYAIFEGTVPIGDALSGPTADTFGARVKQGQSIGRKSRSFIAPVLSGIGWGELGTALARSAFLLVRNQLVCLDDLERAGDGLKPRDVLGLVSFLKEQRNCRVVLLLNDEAMPGEDQAEFKRLLEKVIDVSLTFAPSPSEAAAIALAGSEAIDVHLRHDVKALGITNIRVIKKIERLAHILSDRLSANRPEVLKNAVAACAVAGWSVFDSVQAPPLEFVRDYNAILLEMQDRANEPSPETVRWRDHLAAVPFAYADDFDKVVIEGVELGFFDEARLAEEAKKLEQQLARQKGGNAYSRAWDSYHHSLVEDDEVAIDAIRQGAWESFGDIDPSNINAAITLLREFGRADEATELALAYVEALPNEPQWLNIGSYHFMPDQVVDPALETAFRERYDAFEDTRDPKSVLIEISNGRAWNDEDERLLSKLSADEFQILVEGTTGPDLRRVVTMALRMASSQNENAIVMRGALYEALGRIAAKSTLRARRLRNWGFVART